MRNSAQISDIKIEEIATFKGDDLPKKVLFHARMKILRRLPYLRITLPFECFFT